MNVDAGQLVHPKAGTAYIIRQGYVRVEVDITTPRGIITFFLGTVEEGELLFEEELLGSHDICDYELRYRTEIDVVLLPLTKAMLPQTVERWATLFLTFVRAICRQRSKLYKLASILAQEREELERTLQRVPVQQPKPESEERARLQRELQSLRGKLQMAESRAREALKRHAEISGTLVGMRAEQEKQSDGTLDIVNKALQKFGKPPIDRMALMSLLMEPPKEKMPPRDTSSQNPDSKTLNLFRKKALVPQHAAPIQPQHQHASLFVVPNDTADDEPDSGPITKDWGRFPTTR